QASPKPGETCAVEGTVVKATTGEVLRKITVQLLPVGRRFSAGRGAQPVSALTDAGGRFVFKGIEAGRYSMMASGGSYPPQRYGQRGRFGAGKILELAAGQIEKDIVFRLQPPGVITGTVYDEDGDPAVNAQVVALRSTRRGSGRAFMTNAAAQTNDRGEYRIFGLEAGQYLVVAVDPQRQQAGANDVGDNVYLPTYHPGAPDPEQAIPIQVQPDQEASGIDVSLRLVHGVHLRGLVQGAPSALRARGRLGGVWVSLLPRDSETQTFTSYGVGVQNETGGFDIPGVPPGSYYLIGGWNY